jgi:phosphate:Na+ symporter
LITLEAGIPMVFGANIGTCITAGLACIGTTREAKRVALAHVLFKIAGVALFIFWIPAFADMIRAIAAQFGSGVARQIANAHTIFNVSLGRMLRAIIIPFMSDKNLIKKGGLPKEETDLLVEEIPTQDEIFPQLTLLEGIDMREKKIDFLDEKVREYMIKVARQELSDEQAGEVYGMISIANDMESIGDIIHRNMMPLIDKKQKLETDFSIEGKEELMIYHVKVCNQISRLKEAFTEHNLETARKIMPKRASI